MNKAKFTVEWIEDASGIKAGEKRTYDKKHYPLFKGLAKDKIVKFVDDDEKKTAEKVEKIKPKSAVKVETKKPPKKKPAAKTMTSGASLNK
nr:hypothetical protein 11 [bacterium]